MAKIKDDAKILFDTPHLKLHRVNKMPRKKNSSITGASKITVKESNKFARICLFPLGIALATPLSINCSLKNSGMKMDTGK